MNDSRVKSTVAMAVICLSVVVCGCHRVTEPFGTARLTGVVKIIGKPPANERKASRGKAGDQCQDGDAIESYTTNSDGALANVAVFVERGLEGVRYPEPEEFARWIRQDCKFAPHVLNVMAKQRIVVENRDPVQHVFRVESDPNRFRFVQLGHKSTEYTPTTSEIGIPVLCPLHPWMRAVLNVFDNPFFAITDKNGEFQLERLPAGTFTIAAFHEKLGRLRRKIRLGSDEVQRIAFTFDKAPVRDR
jgi:hypothetical protein